jgi:hypothetical protein
VNKYIFCIIIATAFLQIGCGFNSAGIPRDSEDPGADEHTSLYEQNWYPEDAPFPYWYYTVPPDADVLQGTPPDTPIDPYSWMKFMGHGLNSKFSINGSTQTGEYRFTPEIVRQWQSKGFRGGRLMVGPLEIADLEADPQGRILKQESLSDIRDTVRIFTDEGMPILLSFADGGPVESPMEGYSQTDSWENRQLNFERICAWWRQIAEACKDVSYNLAFEIFVEYHGFEEELNLVYTMHNGEFRYGSFSTQGDGIDNVVGLPGMNNLYNEVIKTIRVTNPHRIVVFKPSGRGQNKLDYITPWRWDTENPDPRDGYWALAVGGGANARPEWLSWSRTGDDSGLQDVIDTTWGPALEYYNGTKNPIWIDVYGIKNDPADNWTITELAEYVTWYLDAAEANGLPCAFQQVWWIYDWETMDWIADYDSVVSALSAGSWSSYDPLSDGVVQPPVLPWEGVDPTFTFEVIEDGQVDIRSPDESFGDMVFFYLKPPGAFERQAFLKFEINGLTGTISSADLKVFNTGSIGGNVDVYGVGDNSWGEMDLTWDEAPIAGTLITSTSTSAGDWMEIDLSGYISGNGVYSVNLRTETDTTLQFLSSESVTPPFIEITLE